VTLDTVTRSNRIGDLALSIGGVVIPASGFTHAGVILAAACALLTVWRRVGWRGSLALAAALVGGIWGARVWGALFYDQRPLIAAALGAFRLFYSGSASILGGLVAGVVACITSASLLRLSVATVGSCFLPSVAIGQAIGRLGCLVTGCCFGGPTSLPWGIRYSAMSVAGFSMGPRPLHPTQLYESVADLVLGVLLLYLLLRRDSKWLVIGLYCVGYGSIRVLVEFLRVDQPAMSLLPLLTALCLVVGGAVVIGASQKFTKRRMNRAGFTGGPII